MDSASLWNTSITSISRSWLKDLACRCDRHTGENRPHSRLEQTLTQISSLRSCNRWFGLKLQPSQLKPWCRKIDTPIDLLKTIFPSWTVIPLLRRDWFSQLAFLIISRAIGADELGLNFSWCAGGELLNPRRHSQARGKLQTGAGPQPDHQVAGKTPGV